MKIGTCFTNSLIALTLANDPVEFKRAFSAATINDIFNFLTTGVLLPLEIGTNFLLISSEHLTRLIPLHNAEKIAKLNFVAKILDPVTNKFIRLNTTALDQLTNGNINITKVSMSYCGASNSKCYYLTKPLIDSLGDFKTGIILIVLSILILIFSLYWIVKVLSLFIVGPIAKGIRIALNASLPGKFRLFTQFILFFFAFLFTIIVQSSNITTATLVPLCGIGMISLQRVYVMTLGSNIGTTVTGIVSAFTLPAAALGKGLQLAFVYTLFNSLGVLFWLPIRALRLPKVCARELGKIVLEYRWFLYVYIFSVYFILPMIVFALALIPHWIGLAAFGTPFILFVLIIVFLNLKFKQSESAPIWLRSLKPYDQLIKKLFYKSDYDQFDRILDSKEANRLRLANQTRRFTVISSLVREAAAFKAMNTIDHILESDEDDRATIKVIKDAHNNKSCDF